MRANAGYIWSNPSTGVRRCRLRLQEYWKDPYFPKRNGTHENVPYKAVGVGSLTTMKYIAPVNSNLWWHDTYNVCRTQSEILRQILGTWMPKTRKSTNLNRGYITRSLLRKKYEGHCGRRKENYREDTRDNSSSETLTSWHTQHTWHAPFGYILTDNHPPLQARWLDYNHGGLRY